jgi:hypothetical protein
MAEREHCPTCGAEVRVVGTTTMHYEPVPGRVERVLTSAADFFVGEELRLRPEDGGGTWRVVEILPRTADNFARALAERAGER